MSEMNLKDQLFDEDNPYSVINVVNVNLAKLIRDIPEKYFTMEEAELRRNLDPNTIDYAIRISFWREYTKAIDKTRAHGHGGKINNSDIYTGIVTSQFFYVTYLNSKVRIAWMIRPYPRYMARGEALLVRFWERMEEVTQIPLYIVDKGGNRKYNANHVKIFLDAMKYVEDRIRGPIVRQVESKNVNQNMNLEFQTAVPILGSQRHITKEDMEKEIREIEGELSDHGTINSSRNGDSDIQIDTDETVVEEWNGD